MDRAVALFAGYFARPALTSPPPAGLPEFLDGKEAIRWCERENENIITLVRYGAAAGWDIRACRLAVMSMPFREQRVHLAQWYR